MENRRQPTVTDESRPQTLYDSDFMLWTEDQAKALRGAKGANLPLDWDNLAEEIESLGKSDRRAIHSQVRRIVRHLLKLAASYAERPRGGWQLTIREARSDVAAILRDSPSLRREIDGIIAEEGGLAGELAVADLEEYGELTPAVRHQMQRTN